MDCVSLFVYKGITYIHPLGDHVPFPVGWISVLIHFPMKRSRNTMPLVEISLWLMVFGASSLSERLGAPDGLFNFG